MSVNYSLQGNLFEINLNLACVILFNNTPCLFMIPIINDKRVLNHLFSFLVSQ
jgi:hypothetical protein